VATFCTRARRLALSAATVCALVGVTVPTVTGSPAAAASIASVQARIAQLDSQINRLAETYDGARVVLGRDRVAFVAVRDAIRRAVLQQGTYQHRVDAFAVAAYSTGSPDPLLTLLQTDSPQTFLDQSSDLSVLSRAQAEALQGFAAAARQLAAAERSAQHAFAVQRRVLRRIAAARNRIEQALAQEQTLLAQLTAAQRAAMAAAAASARAAQAATVASYTPPLYSGPASGQAAVAVRFAYDQLGKPYQWGGAGPDSYDCSGLTMASWAAAGVSLPHNAAMQQQSVPPVPMAAIQPGDLVFFGQPAYHVGIYVGHGDMIDAPHTGANVELVSLSYESGISSIGRP
jgi:cell wall-associated NlpC family hydrolase